MKTVTGRVRSEKPISLSKAATLLSSFVSSETEASQDVAAYLRRASAAFTELKSFHREIRSTKVKDEQNPSVEVEEPRSRKQDDKKKSREEAVVEEKEKETVKLEEDQGNKERKKKKGEDVVEEKVNVKLEEEQRNDEKKKKKKKGEDAVEERKEKKKRKSDGEIGSEERKSKKKRKSKVIDAS